MTEQSSARDAEPCETHVQDYWLTCKRFTIKVSIDSQQVIVQAAPIARRFVGQPLSNLAKWMQGFGGFEAKLI